MPKRTDGSAEHPLDAIFGTVASVRILRTLSDGGAHAPPYLAAKTRISRPSTREALIRLEAQRIISRVGEGRTVLYQLNKSHPLARRIVKLFRVEQKHPAPSGKGS
jgi:DNA-binding transcriptional ArsR family regulator